MQQVWRKTWRNTGWVALGAITLVLFVSAVNKKNHRVCTGIEVTFNKDGSNFFLDEKGVVTALKSVASIIGEPVENIDLKALEQKLKSDLWIATAELFFDNKQVLQVIVEEKEPVARIFTVEGSSFYIDSACKRLPLSAKLSARVPMFTSFPSGRAVLSRPDSELLASAKELAIFIQADDFWKAQVAQIDITPNGFEMIPTVGSHVVELGKDGDWQQKFDRLFSFYKQVWTKTGFEKYERLAVQFDGQVVATVKGAKPAKVDSVKAKMAYENVLAEVKKSEADSIGDDDDNKTIVKDTAKAKASVVSKPGVKLSNAANQKILPAKANILKPFSKTVAVKTAPVKMPLAKQTTVKQVAKPLAANKKADDRKVAKAVMKRK